MPNFLLSVSINLVFFNGHFMQNCLVNLVISVDPSNIAPGIQLPD